MRTRALLHATTAPAITMSNVSEVRLIDLPRHARADGELVVAETTSHVPYAIARVFIVRAPADSTRGDHAHRRCSQFMICANGAVKIACDDGVGRRSFVMERADSGLLVPPGIWATLCFRESGSVVVLCDRRYEADDYIRSYDDFLAARTRAVS